MKKSFIILIGIALATIGVLYSLPKVVVQDDKRPTKAAPMQEASAETVNPATDTHQQPLSPQQQQSIAKAKAAFETTKPTEERIRAAEQLVELFAKATRFDSAAYYAGEVAQLQPTVDRFLKAGDRYYEAFTFAVNSEKAATLGEKTRDWYQKALDQNPNLLQAKSNLAMTYVSTTNPMQGIAMLREILEQDPDFEPALFNMGILSMRSNQYEKAVGRFERILRNQPNNTRTMFYLGICYAEMGQKDKAVPLLKEVQTKETDPTILAGVREYLEQLK
ncbi:MAG: tetratricopeptide repeat protein [Siphonobacter sp.]